jgi:hypothetical protein
LHSLSEKQVAKTSRKIAEEKLKKRQSGWSFKPGEYSVKDKCSYKRVADQTLGKRIKTAGT